MSIKKYSGSQTPLHLGGNMCLVDLSGTCCIRFLWKAIKEKINWHNCFIVPLFLPSWNADPKSRGIYTSLWPLTEQKELLASWIWNAYLWATYYMRKIDIEFLNHWNWVSFTCNWTSTLINTPRLKPISYSPGIKQENLSFHFWFQKS